MSPALAIEQGLNFGISGRLAGSDTVSNYIFLTYRNTK